MKKRNAQLLILFLACLSMSCGQQEKDKEKTAELESQKVDDRMVRNRSKTYMEALNNRDLDTLVNFWSDEAVYRNPLTGDLVHGKEAIRREYQKLFDQLKGAKIELKMRSVEFPFEDKAVEEGTASLFRSGNDPKESEYKIIYVKRNGAWRILNVSRIDFGVVD